MKILKFIILFFIFGLIIWIDLPENLKINFKFGKQNINFRINPLTIDTKIFGMQFKKEFKDHLGLDLKGGSHLVFEADSAKVRSEDLQDALNSVRDIIERRVNLFGVSEPVVQMLKSGNIHRVSVDLPGITDINEAVNLIGQTAQLSFVELASSEAKIASEQAFFKQTGLTGKHVKKAQVTFDSQNGKPQVGLEFSQEGGKIFA